MPWWKPDEYLSISKKKERKTDRQTDKKEVRKARCLALVGVHKDGDVDRKTVDAIASSDGHSVQLLVVDKF